MDSSENTNTQNLFKKRCRFIKGLNKRKVESSDEDSNDEETIIVKKNKKSLSNPLIQSTSCFNKKRTFKNFDNDEENNLNKVSIIYKSNKSENSILPRDMGATSTLEIDTERDRDAQAIFEKARKINNELKDIEDPKVYKGLNNYKQYIQKKDSVLGNASSGLVRQGPIRAPENVRSTVRWDYQPDICKDYKETGFCGFGDSCKFLHDRSDYKHGWQIELETQKNTYNKEDEEDYEIKEEQLPFKCLKCRKSFKNPIVTKCKHYFCECCALNHHRKSTKCYVCGMQTQGIFNPAKDLIKKLAQKKENGEYNEDENDESSSSEESTKNN